MDGKRAAAPAAAAGPDTGLNTELVDIFQKMAEAAFESGSANAR